MGLIGRMRPEGAGGRVTPQDFGESLEVGFGGGFVQGQADVGGVDMAEEDTGGLGGGVHGGGIRDRDREGVEEGGVFLSRGRRRGARLGGGRAGRCV